MTHTPGPWKVGKGIAFACSIYSGQTNVAFARQDHGRIDAPQAEANARLIAAAPALLEALESIIAHFPNNIGNAPGHCHDVPGVWDRDASNGERGGTECDWCRQWQAARAAIAQARGQANG